MTEAGSDSRRYAVRRVNPFEGVLQVVETHNARAYSPNGHVWQVQVLTQRPDHTWRSFGDVEPIEQFFNFGLWDAVEGLHRIPASPILDIGDMQAAADEITGVLRRVVADLPFALIDDYEYWATDYDGRPVALLATTENPRLLHEIRVSRWQATRVADHSFTSPSLLARELPTQGHVGPRQHAETLERQVRQLGQQKAWFRRSSEGDGERLHPKRADTKLTAEVFPPLGLKSDWTDDLTRELAADYLAWQAPMLLTLQRIDDVQRHWLEQHACHRAVELAAAYRLIPRILDKPRLEAARVEARLRRSAVCD